MVTIRRHSKPKKRILILSANPEGTVRLHLNKEISDIEEALTRATYRDQFDIRSRLAVCPRDIRLALLEYKPHIVHFSGHGNEEGIMVEGELGLAVPVSSQVLSGLFALCASYVECVILNACYTASQAAAINKHIKHVIGMRREIKDTAAIQFSIGFYDALGAGRSVEDAFKVGCLAIKQEFQGLPEHLIPILKKRKEKMIKIRVRIENLKENFNFQVDLDEKTSNVKTQILNELRLSKSDENGQPINYYLFNRTGNKIMEDNKTLRENSVQPDDVFVFLLEVDA